MEFLYKNDLCDVVQFLGLNVNYKRQYNIAFKSLKLSTAKCHSSILQNRIPYNLLPKNNFVQFSAKHKPEKCIEEDIFRIF